jgi:predicted transposase/invertase (TIGR01784 family)
MTIAESLRQQGIERGRKEGRQEGRQEVALNLLKEGMAIDRVVKVTELSEVDVRELAKSIH